MSYQVLARKWRPGTFSELAGQEHVQRALINALDSQRLHHAFLFTGTRGVGKTTIARILAKSLNCEQGVTATPCGTCSTCTEINEGRFVDLIEVDAASKTKVEDTRELLENVQYAPTRGRYKVYLIDEVHMLSAHSFNALLKTLEEPPPHVKFLLATTDPQRLPVTILSRCLQFNLKRLPVDLIQQHLDHILKQEDITAESAALKLIAEAADGSMRDALSLMDQAIAYGNGALQTTDVQRMLGTVDKKYIYDIMQQLAERNTAMLLDRVKELATQSPDFISVLNELITLLHHIALAQLAPSAIGDQLSEKSKILALAKQLSAQDTQLYYQICLIGKRDIQLAPNPTLGFEMTLLRMLAFHPETNQSRIATTKPAGNTLDPVGRNTSALSQQASQQDHSTANETSRLETANTSHQQKSRHLADINEKLKTGAQKKTPDHVAPTTKPVAQPIEPAIDCAQSKTTDTTTIPNNERQWEQFIEKLPINAITLQLAKNCALIRSDQNSIELQILESHKQLISNKRIQDIEQAIRDLTGTSIKLSISTSTKITNTPANLEHQRKHQRQQSAEASIHNDTAVQKILETFDAQISPESIHPIDH
ncbi:MAG: DNA polymerase III subunit gamma/tau [Gammaproteobacteria bacterium]|nr:DNA polymerase III subunit gamma/tau [Gammaproteobacteria bacterium]